MVVQLIAVVETCGLAVDGFPPTVYLVVETKDANPHGKSIDS